MNEKQIALLIVALLKIALMVFTVIHVLFLGFVMRRIISMRQQLSTLHQWFIVFVGMSLIVGLLALLLYIILLP